MIQGVMSKDLWGKYFTNVTQKKQLNTVAETYRFGVVFLGPNHLISKTMTKEVYKSILEEVHSSKLVSFWFNENNIRLLEWASQSLNLNPTENLWGDLKKRLRKENTQNEFKKYTTICQLKLAVKLSIQCPTESIMWT